MCISASSLSIFIWGIHTIINRGSQVVVIDPVNLWNKTFMPSSEGCWLWRGSRNDRGYGRIGTWREGGFYTHRVSYELAYGEIPEGLTIDHLCRNTSCLNPTHLEAVTIAENLRRGTVLITHCPHGHEYTAENTYRRPDNPNKRECLYCRNHRKIK